MITLYGIKNCDSVKKARKWLEANGCEYRFHDFRADGLDEKTVKSWLKHCDWETVLNRRSTSWKQLSEQQRANVTANNVIALLLETPTLVKRPVATQSATVLIGFREAEYSKHFL